MSKQNGTGRSDDEEAQVRQHTKQKRGLRTDQTPQNRGDQGAAWIR
jgi:hypothetical protein